jgi:thymidylate synthase (FAD)
MGNLESLIKQFKPKRTFSCSHSKIEVDGVFVRVASDEENDSWKEVKIPSTSEWSTHYLIKVDDLLQDPAVIRSARVSTGRDNLVVDEKAQGLMNYLWREYHVSPYESGVVFRLRVETPIVYADPLMRFFASFNEFSGRYSNIDTGFYVPSNMKETVQRIFKEDEEEANYFYRELLDFGLAKEMARLCLPYRYYTKFYMTISLRHLMEFLTIRELNNRHTTTEFWEIRDLFEQIIKHWTPWAYGALTLYPKENNYNWLKDYTDKYNINNILPYMYRVGVNVLDHGVVELINVSGSADLILSCLDDFPNPLRGLSHGRITFFVRTPIHVFRQWVRHRYGTITQIKPDYDWIVKEDMFFIPRIFRRQIGKTGSYMFSDMNDNDNSYLREKMKMYKNKQVEKYLNLRQIGVSQEIAMMLLPSCFYVSMIVTKPIESIFNFISLRTDSHAQAEIREYAHVIWKMFSSAFPKIAELFSKNLYWGDSMEVKKF